MESGRVRSSTEDQHKAMLYKIRQVGLDDRPERGSGRNDLLRCPGDYPSPSSARVASIACTVVTRISHPLPAVTCRNTLRIRAIWTSVAENVGIPQPWRKTCSVQDPRIESTIAVLGGSEPVMTKGGTS